MPASSSCMQTADLIVHGSPAWRRDRVAMLYITGIEQQNVAQVQDPYTALGHPQGNTTNLAKCDSPLLLFRIASVYLMCPCTCTQ